MERIVLIETYWNVKKVGGIRDQTAVIRINRNILECKEISKDARIAL